MLQQHWMPCRNSDAHHWKTLKNKNTSRIRIFAPNPSKTMRRRNLKIVGNYKPIPSIKLQKIFWLLTWIMLLQFFPESCTGFAGNTMTSQQNYKGTCRTLAIPWPPSPTDICFLRFTANALSHPSRFEHLISSSACAAVSPLTYLVDCCI